MWMALLRFLARVDVEDVTAGPALRLAHFFSHPRLLHGSAPIALRTRAGIVRMPRVRAKPSRRSSSPSPRGRARQSPDNSRIDVFSSLAVYVSVYVAMQKGGEIGTVPFAPSVHKCAILRHIC